MTPSITHGSILPGITRKSVIELLRHWGYEVEETRITVDDLMEAIRKANSPRCSAPAPPPSSLPSACSATRTST